MENKKVIRIIELFKIISLLEVVLQVFLVTFYKLYDLQYMLETKGGSLFVVVSIVVALSWIISAYMVTKTLKVYKKTTLFPILAPAFIIGGVISQIAIVIYLWIKANALIKEISQEKRYVVTYWAICLFMVTVLTLHFHPGNIGQEFERAREIRETREDAHTWEEMYVNAGKEFSISLDSNQPTGYKWQLVPLHTEMVKFVGETYMPNETKPLSEGGKQIWIFRTHNIRGGTTLYFEYVNSLEKNIPPTKKKDIRVNIR